MKIYKNVWKWKFRVWLCLLTYILNQWSTLRMYQGRFRDWKDKGHLYWFAGLISSEWLIWQFRLDVIEYISNKFQHKLNRDLSFTVDLYSILHPPWHIHREYTAGGLKWLLVDDNLFNKVTERLTIYPTCFLSFTYPLLFIYGYIITVLYCCTHTLPNYLYIWLYLSIYLSIYISLYLSINPSF